MVVAAASLSNTPEETLVNKTVAKQKIKHNADVKYLL